MRKFLCAVMVLIMITLPFSSAVGNIVYPNKDCETGNTFENIVSPYAEKNAPAESSGSGASSDAYVYPKPEYGCLEENSLIYDDGKAWWLFTPTSEDEATIVGVWFYDKTVTELIIPGTVISNASVETISAEYRLNPVSHGTYLVLELDIIKAGTNDHVTKYVNMKCVDGGLGELNLSFDDLSDSSLPEATDAIEVSKNARITVSGAKYIAMKAKGMSDDFKPAQVRVDGGVIMPDRLKPVSSGTDYSVTAVGDYAVSPDLFKFQEFLSGASKSSYSFAGTNCWLSDMSFSRVFIPKSVKYIGNYGIGEHKLKSTDIDAFYYTYSIEYEEGSLLEYIGDYGLSIGYQHMYSGDESGGTSDDVVTSYVSKEDFSDYETDPAVRKIAAAVKAGSDVTVKIHTKNPTMFVLYGFYSGDDWDNDGIDRPKFIMPEGGGTANVFELNTNTSVEGAKYLVVMVAGKDMDCAEKYVRLVFEIKSDEPEADTKNFTETVLPKSVKYLGKGSLQKVQKLTIEEGSALEYIGDDAFRLLNPLYPATFPGTVRHLGIHEDVHEFLQGRYVPNPFNAEARVVFETGNRYSSENGFLMDGTTVIGYFGDDPVMRLPVRAQAVAEAAFYRNPVLKHVNMTDDVSWGEYAFREVELESLTFDSSVREIPASVFQMITIPELTIPANIEVIGDYAFTGSNIKRLVFENGTRITEVGQGSFGDSGLEEIVFGSHANGFECSLEHSCFLANDELRKVTIHEEFSLTYIGMNAFHKNSSNTIATFNSDEGITIPSSVSFIGLGAFSQYCLTETSNYPIVFEGKTESPSQLYQIERNAFYRVKATSVDFSQCSKLEYIYHNNFNTLTIREVKFPENGNLKLCLGFDIDANYMTGYVPPLDTIYIPDTVLYFGYMSIAKEIKFGKDSELKDFLGVLGSISVDLSGCRHLESLRQNGNLTVPEGVYSMPSRWGGIVGHHYPDEYGYRALCGHQWSDSSFKINNSGSVILSGDVCEISSEIRTVNRDLLGKSVFTGSNSLFSVEDGTVVYTHDGKHEIVGPADPSMTEVTVRKDSNITGIAANAFSGTSVTTLNVYKDGISIGDSIFGENRTADVYFLCSLDSLEFGNSPFAGMIEEASFYVTDGKSPVTDMLHPYGKINVGFTRNGKTVFMPEYIGGMKAEYSTTNGTAGLAVSVSMPKGYSVYDIAFSADGAVLRTENAQTLAVDTDKKFVFVTAALKDRTAEPSANAAFDSAGGKITGMPSVRITRGLSLIDAEIPVAAKDGYDFAGWYRAGSASEYDFDSPLTEDIVLIAHWNARSATVMIDTVAGDVLFNGRAADRINTAGLDEVKLTFRAADGFEAFEWVYAANGRVYRQNIGSDLVLTDLASDITVTVDYRYCSPSVGLSPISKTGLFTGNDVPTIAKSWEIGGIIDTSQDRWTGHSSIPLIVGNYVYLRIGDKIYKAESDTGYIVGSAPSLSTRDFYHNISYGGGVILDCYTGTAYDLDLNELYKLDRIVKRLEYYDGYFYSSDKTVLGFPSDPSEAVNGIMAVEPVGTFSYNAYSNYSYASCTFKDGYMYRVLADGRERGIGAMCVDRNSEDYGKTSYVLLEEMKGMFLDDGWIYEWNGTLYIQGYINGMFGAVADTGGVSHDKIGYVKVDGLIFGEPNYVDLEGRMWASGFIVANGYGFLCDGWLNVWKMNDDGTPGEKLAQKEFSVGHGGMVIDVSRATEENGFLTYAYSIPYDGASMYIAECYHSAQGYKIHVTKSINMELNYNSQAIRAGLDGQGIWYNDSGHVFAYTTPEKNPFYIFADCGDTAVWMKSAGSNPGDAVSRLGQAKVSLKEDGSVLSVNGIEGEWKLFALTGGINERLAEYEWTEVTDMNSAEYAWCHYLVLTRNNSVERGQWYYGADGEPVGYVFADNIGDRSLVGVQLRADSGEVSIPVSGVAVSGGTDGTLFVGSDVDLSAEIAPANATNTFVIWVSSDRSVATVNDSGTVTGISPGKAVITAITHDGGFASSYTVEIILSKIVEMPVTETANADGSVTKTTGSVTTNADGSVVTETVKTVSRGGTASEVKNTTVIKKADGTETEKTTTVKFARNRTSIISDTSTMVIEGNIPFNTSGLQFSVSELKPESLTEAQREKAGTATVFDIKLTSDGTNITQLGGAVSITLKGAVPKDTDWVVKAWYAAPDGSMEEIDVEYDRSTGDVTITTDHLSVYVIGYEEPSATDSAVVVLIFVAAVIIEIILLMLWTRRSWRS